MKKVILILILLLSISFSDVFYSGCVDVLTEGRNVMLSAYSLDIDNPSEMRAYVQQLQQARNFISMRRGQFGSQMDFTTNKAFTELVNAINAMIQIANRRAEGRDSTQEMIQKYEAAWERHDVAYSLMLQSPRYLNDY